MDTGKLKNIFKLSLFNISYHVNHPLMAPRILQISLTNRCNLRCKICSVHRYCTKDEEEMTAGELEKIIRNSKEVFNINQLILTGGEPLLVVDKVLMASEVAKSLGLEVVLTTNGYFLSENAEALIASGIKHFRISVDGLKETHNMLRNNALSFDKAIEGIKRLISLRRRRRDFFVGTGTLILKSNLDDIYRLFEYTDMLGVDSFDLLIYIPDNTDFSVKEKDAFWLEEGDVKKFDDIYNRISATKTRGIILNSLFQIGLVKRYYLGLLTSREWRCFAGYKNFFITLSDPKRQGRFEPCVFMCKANIPIRDYNYDFKKIWYSAQARSTRKFIKQCSSYCYQQCFSLPSMKFALMNQIYF